MWKHALQCPENRPLLLMWSNSNKGSRRGRTENPQSTARMKTSTASRLIRVLSKPLLLLFPHRRPPSSPRRGALASVASNRGAHACGSLSPASAFTWQKELRLQRAAKGSRTFQIQPETVTQQGAGRELDLSPASLLTSPPPKRCASARGNRPQGRWGNCSHFRRQGLNPGCPFYTLCDLGKWFKLCTPPFPILLRIKGKNPCNLKLLFKKIPSAQLWS